MFPKVNRVVKRTSIRLENKTLARRKFCLWKRIQRIEGPVTHYSDKLAKNFSKHFTENKKYNVKFRDDFTVKQQRGRIIPIHVQEAGEKKSKS